MKQFLKTIGLTLLPSFINLLIKTLKIEIHNQPKESSNNVFIFWHSRMIIGWWLFRNIPSAALVSQSSDGEILSRLLKSWNYKVVRGSSSRGGREALKKITELAKQNYNVIITPDGPRGPLNEIKNGALIISNECNIPVIPVKIIYHKKKILSRSWDKFEIPLPFSKCDVHFGNEYTYTKYLREPDLEEFKKRISKEM